MKITRWSIAGLVGLIGLVGVSQAQPRPLALFNFEDYIAPEVIKGFEQRFGVKVSITTYKSNEEMVNRLNRGGVNKYDVIFPSSYILPILTNSRLVRQLDMTLIPNAKNLGKQFSQSGTRYALPYFWGTTGIGYRKDKIKNLNPSWALLLDPTKQPGPFTLIDDARPMIGGALKYLGKSYNSIDATELQAAQKLLENAKTRSKGFTNSPDAAEMLLSGKTVIGVMYNAEAARAAQANPNIGYFIPKEGAELWYDSMAVVSGSKNTKLAYQFINYMLEAKTAALNANITHNATPVDAAKPFLKADDLNNPIIYPAESSMDKLEIGLNLGNNQQMYEDIWSALKAK